MPYLEELRIPFSEFMDIDKFIQGATKLQQLDCGFLYTRFEHEQYMKLVEVCSSRNQNIESILTGWPNAYSSELRQAQDKYHHIVSIITRDAAIASNLDSAQREILKIRGQFDAPLFREPVGNTNFVRYIPL